MKRMISATLLATALLAAPMAQAASYEDRAMATGAVIGATGGAVVGSTQNRVVEGAIIGAVFGTIAGAIIADQHQPTYVAYQPHRAYRIQPRHIEQRSYRDRDRHSYRNARYERDSRDRREYRDHDRR